MTKIRKFVAFIVTVLAGSSFGTKALAQNPSNFYVEEPRTFYAGVLVGANFAQVDGDSYAGYHKIGLNVGGIVYAYLADHLATSLEILFSQKGAKGNEQQQSGVGNIITKDRIDLNYAEIPIQINYFDRRRSHFGAGFSYSQLISSKEVIETNPPNSLNLENYPFKSSDVNFIVGGNLHLIKGLFLNTRFQYSIFSIRKNIPPGYGRAAQYNNMWTLRLMYLF